MLFYFDFSHTGKSMTTWFAFSTILFSLLLTSCHSEPPKPLRIGTNIWIGYETLYLARSLGYCDNLPIKLVELPSATEVLHAFRNHTLEVAALTLDETLSLLQSETDLKIILIMDISKGGDALLAKPNITTLHDIKGKRVGVESTAVGAILLDGALSSVKLTPADIDIIPLTVDHHLAAYQNNQVDAVITFEPVKKQLLDLGATNLFDSSQIPNRIVDVLVTRQHIIDQRPDDLKQLLSTYFKALAYIHKNPRDASVRIAPRLGLSSTEIQNQYDGIKIPDLNENHLFLNGEEPTLKDSSAKLASLMYQKELLYKQVDSQYLMNGSLLPVLQ